MFLPLRGFGQEEFWKESLDPSQVKVHFCKLFPLRLGIDRAPVFVALRHLLYFESLAFHALGSNAHATETDANRCNRIRVKIDGYYSLLILVIEVSRKFLSDATSLNIENRLQFVLRDKFFRPDNNVKGSWPLSIFYERLCY